MKTILVVDDDAFLVEYLAQIINQMNFTALTFTEPENAYLVAKSQHIDLIITDLHMPSMSGLELIKKMRELPQHQDTPIFMLTAEKSFDLIQKGKELRINAWAVKPFDKDKIYQAIQSLLQSPIIHKKAVPVILIVDDNEFLTESISRVLKARGYETICSNNPEKVLELAEKIHADLIISDYHMPNLDGLSLIAEIRKIAHFKTTPVLMLTAENDTELIKKAKNIGVNAWAIKPLDQIDKLVQSVQKLLNN